MINKSFIKGSITSAVCCSLVFLYILGAQNQTQKTDTTVEESNVSYDTKQYKTDIVDWTINTNSGESVKFKTPSGYYSLSDQYLDNLASYYELEEIKSDSIVVVGDSSTPFNSKVLLNADCISDVSSMLTQIHGQEVLENDVTESEAYTYMRTGKLPDTLPDNYSIQEVDKYTINGVNYVAYEVNYDTTYNKDKEDERVVHTQQIVCYSDTEDAIEIVVYQEEFDKEVAIKVLKEFLNIKEK